MQMPRSHQMDNRLNALALMAVYHEGSSAEALLEFMSDKEKSVCRTKIQEIIISSPSKLKEKALLKIQALISAESFNGISEIHPAWIYEAIKDEPPRIMGVIMRYLPSKQVRYILQKMPEDVRAKIPSLLESFAVPKPVMELIINNFTSRFLSFHVSKHLKKYGFENVHFLNGEELHALFIELGVLEVAMALEGVSDKLLSVVLNRLNLKDAKKLHHRMGEIRGVSKGIKQQARYAILELGDELDDPEQMLLEVGFGSFAKAVAGEMREVYELIRQKLSPHEAYKLRRLIDENFVGNPPALVEERKNLVLNCIAMLAREKVIDENWEKFAV